MFKYFPRYIPKMAVLLIGVFTVLFIVDAFVTEGFLFKLGTLDKTKLIIHRQWWRSITASFFHTGIPHLFRYFI